MNTDLMGRGRGGKEEGIGGRKIKHCMFSLMKNPDLRYMCACAHMRKQKEGGEGGEDNGGRGQKSDKVQ